MKIRFLVAAQSAEVERILKHHLLNATLTDVQTFLEERRLGYGLRKPDGVKADFDSAIVCMINGVKIPWTKFERVRHWPWEWMWYWLVDHAYDGDHTVQFNFRDNILVEITVTANDVPLP